MVDEIDSANERLDIQADPSEFPEEELRWSQVQLSEVLEQQTRLTASVYDIEGRHARDVLHDCPWPVATVSGENGLATAYHFPRFKRIWVERSDYPVYQPGQINELDPNPSGYLSPRTPANLEKLRVSHGQILMTCSGRAGSIGRTTYVSKTLDGRIFSHDLIRIDCNEFTTAGYLFAFLRTKVGRALIKTNEYGAMIPHIEPAHLSKVPVPVASESLRRKIHGLIVHSYALRDQANTLLRDARARFCQAFKLQDIDQIYPDYFDDQVSLRNFSQSLSNLQGRLDASSHTPLASKIIEQMQQAASELTTIGDERISRNVILPGRFARVYVEEGQGVPFFGGKQIHELDPTGKKYLSLQRHGDRIRDQLTLTGGMTLITCSGTIGKVAYAPNHWTGWTANQHIIRVVPASDRVGGYLYAFLSTPHGRELIRRYSYGSAVQEIDNRQVSQIPVPIPVDPTVIDKIGDLVLDASAKLTEAYHSEQEAIRLVNDEVIHADG